MNAKLWLHQQLLPLLKDHVQELEFGCNDEILDNIELIVLLLRRNSKQFRKIISYFSKEGATTPTIAVQELTSVTIKTVRKTLNDLYEAGICDRQPLSIFKTDIKKTQSKAQVFYVEKSFVNLFLEKHYNQTTKPVYFCERCGFEKQGYEDRAYCLTCFDRENKIVPLELKK